MKRIIFLMILTLITISFLYATDYHVNIYGNFGDGEGHFYINGVHWDESELVIVEYLTNCVHCKASTWVTPGVGSPITVIMTARLPGLPPGVGDCTSEATFYSHSYTPYYLPPIYILSEHPDPGEPEEE